MSTAAQAQVQRSFLNGSFEYPALQGSSACWVYIGEQHVPGWITSHPLHGQSSTPGTCFPGIAGQQARIIELWRNMFVPPRADFQHAELNAAATSRISQSVCLLPQETIQWRFSHRGRDSASVADVMQFLVGSQEIVRVGTTNNGTGSVISTTLGSASMGPGVTNGWRDYSGSFNYVGAGGPTNFGFGAISAGGGNNSSGNFLDDIHVVLDPFIEFPTGIFSSLEGASGGEPTIRISGVTPPGGLTLNFEITGGTATLGEDYSTDGGGTEELFSVTLPGNTDYGSGSDVPLGLVSHPDGDPAEGPETVNIRLLDGDGYLVDSTRVCGANPVTEIVWTIRDAAPALTLEKSAARADTNGDDVPSEGDVVTYTFRVTNTGNVVIDEIAIDDPMFTVPAPICALTELDIGETTTCSANYIVQSGDMTAGHVTNTARAVGATPADVPVQSDESVAIVPLAQSPSIALEKHGSHDDGNRGFASVGDIVTYTFTITNTGNVALTGVTLDDPLITAPIAGMPIASLAPGASVTRNATYSVTQADINSGSVLNTATVSGAPPTGEREEGTDTATVRLVQAPRLTLQKTAAPPSAQQEGGEITYTFRVTNTGNVLLNNISIDDPMLDDGTLSCGATSLAANAWTLCTGTHTITQAEMDAGFVANTARALGETEGGLPVVSPPATTNTPLSGTRSMTVDKTVDQLTISAPGTLTYTIEVRNTGTLSLTEVAVTDVLPDGTSPPLGNPDSPAPDVGVVSSGNDDAVLDVGETWTYTLTYEVTPAEIAAGDDLVNVATANATGLSPQDSATTTITANHSISLTKEVDLTSITEPETELTYTITIRNMGNTAIDNLDVVDTLPDGTEPVLDVPDESVVENGILDVGETWIYTVTYTVPEQDFLDEVPSVTNTVTVSTPDGTIPETTHQATTVLEFRREFLVEKRVDMSAIAAPGPLGYTVIVRNTGNTVLTGVTLSDHLPDGTIRTDFDEPDGDLNDDEELDPGEAWTYTYIFEVTQDLIDTGEPLVNEITVETSETSEPQTDTETTLITRNPRIEVEKVVDRPAIGAPGELAYTITVRNIGNIAVGGITVNDTLPGAADADELLLHSGDTDDDNLLDVGEEWIYHATFIVDQTHLDAGEELVNTVEAFSEEIESGPGSPGDPVDAAATTIIQQAPGLAVLKEVDNARISEPGTLTYTVTVTNMGNVSLEGVEVVDTLPDGAELPLSAPQESISANGVLDVGEVWEFEVAFEVDQTRINNGEPLLNTVRASSSTIANGPGSSGEPVVDDVTTEIEQTPNYTVVKTVDQDVISAEATLNYTVTITNIGNVSLADVAVVDTLPDGTELDLTDPDESISTNGILDVGEVWEFEVPFPVDQAAIDTNSSFVNLVSVTTPLIATSRTSTATTAVTREPQLIIEKSARFVDGDGNGFVNAGDSIVFEFTIVNRGNVTLTDVLPQDDGPTFNGQPAANTLSAFDPPGPVTLAPGADAQFEATYILEQIDVDNAAGIDEAVANTAMAAGLFGTAVITSSPSSAVLSIGEQEPSDITIVKRALIGTIRRGETARFEILVTNTSTGNAGLVTITDRIPPGFAFVEESATVDTIEVTPVVSGRDIIFEDVPLGPGAEVVIGLTLRALATASPGQHRNIASITDETGTPLARDAEAIINIAAEAIFDCSEVIGKVFNDLNGNGYQDEGEPGLPGVRLATVRGTLITTDAFGRYSVPCAEMPDQTIGSNFVLKLDERTLPTGFSLTTENPAMMRLTAGKMSEINFGASIGRQVRIDLDPSAFVPGSAEPRRELSGAIDQLIGVLREKQSSLVISYDGQGDTVGGAERLKAIETAINERWRAAGAPYPLSIETRRRGN